MRRLAAGALVVALVPLAAGCGGDGVDPEVREALESYRQAYDDELQACEDVVDTLKSSGHKSTVDMYLPGYEERLKALKEGPEATETNTAEEIEKAAKKLIAYDPDKDHVPPCLYMIEEGVLDRLAGN